MSCNRSGAGSRTSDTRTDADADHDHHGTGSRTVILILLRGRFPDELFGQHSIEHEQHDLEYTVQHFVGIHGEQLGVEQLLGRILLIVKQLERTSSATSSSASSSLSQSIVTITSIVTNSDGSSSTITSASSSAVAVPVQNDSKNGSLSGKTWGIIGGIVGGVAALILGIFVFWKVAKRCSNNRAMDQIAWPELQNDASGGAFSTLNPQGTRRTGGAGFEMGKDHRGDGQYYDDEEEEDHAGEIRRGGWASPRAMSPRLAYDPRMSGQFYGLGGDGQYGYGNEYGQPTPMAHGNYYPYRQEAPLPPLPPGATAGSARPTLPHLPLGSDPSSARHPGGPLPFPGSPVHSFEMAHEPTYPPRSGRPYSGSAEDAYGGYAAGISTDDVPLTATAQPPAGGGGAGPNIPYAGSAGQQHGYRY
ncbi:hypothetical protein BMF94_0618 [Rhodotorula taiwanensis]|uniref:Uncharacterized protein n=1 Tax=Rhodotorula taiwanensis TaxID=741276 RepID=A0A2S5BI23_9BASI|nr:hypothetical protein BMF94_0618 [Rhodotorula taiwanensis]